jgi:hypothetical protein
VAFFNIPEDWIAIQNPLYKRGISFFVLYEMPPALGRLNRSRTIARFSAPHYEGSFSDSPLEGGQGGVSLKPPEHPPNPPEGGNRISGCLTYLNGTENRATNMDDFGPFWTP